MGVSIIVVRIPMPMPISWQRGRQHARTFREPPEGSVDVQVNLIQTRVLRFDRCRNSSVDGGMRGGERERERERAYDKSDITVTWV